MLTSPISFSSDAVKFAKWQAPIIDKPSIEESLYQKPLIATYNPAPDGLFYKQFKQLITHYKALTAFADYQDDLKTFEQNFINGQGDSPYKGKPPAYFEQAKDTLEKILYLLKQRDNMSEALQSQVAAEIISALEVCAPGLHLHLNKVLSSLQSEESLDAWMSELRTNIVYELAQKHMEEKEIADVNEAHVWSSFILMAKEFGFEISDQPIDEDEYIEGAQVDPQDKKQFKKEFLARYTPEMVVDNVSFNIQRWYEKQKDKLGMDKHGWGLLSNYTLARKELECLLLNLKLEDQDLSNYFELDEETTKFRFKPCISQLYQRQIWLVQTFESLGLLGGIQTFDKGLSQNNLIKGFYFNQAPLLWLEVDAENIILLVSEWFAQQQHQGKTSTDLYKQFGQWYLSQLATHTSHDVMPESFEFMMAWLMTQDAQGHEAMTKAMGIGPTPDQSYLQNAYIAFEHGYAEPIAHIMATYPALDDKHYKALGDSIERTSLLLKLASVGQTKPLHQYMQSLPEESRNQILFCENGQLGEGLGHRAFELAGGNALSTHQSFEPLDVLLNYVQISADDINISYKDNSLNPLWMAAYLFSTYGYDSALMNILNHVTLNSKHLLMAPSKGWESVLWQIALGSYEHNPKPILQIIFDEKYDIFNREMLYSGQDSVENVLTNLAYMAQSLYLNLADRQYLCEKLSQFFRTNRHTDQDTPYWNELIVIATQIYAKNTPELFDSLDVDDRTLREMERISLEKENPSYREGSPLWYLIKGSLIHNPEFAKELLLNKLNLTEALLSHAPTEGPKAGKSILYLIARSEAYLDDDDVQPSLFEQVTQRVPLTRAIITQRLAANSRFRNLLGFSVTRAVQGLPNTLEIILNQVPVTEDFLNEKICPGGHLYYFIAMVANLGYSKPCAIMLDKTTLKSYQLEYRFDPVEHLSLTGFLKYMYGENSNASTKELIEDAINNQHLDSRYANAIGVNLRWLRLRSTLYRGYNTLLTGKILSNSLHGINLYRFANSLGPNEGVLSSLWSATTWSSTFWYQLRTGSYALSASAALTVPIAVSYVYHQRAQRTMQQNVNRELAARLRSTQARVEEIDEIDASSEEHLTPRGPLIVPRVNTNHDEELLQRDGDPSDRPRTTNHYSNSH